MRDSGAHVPRVNVLGVGVSAIALDDALRIISQWIAERAPHYVCVTGVHGVMESQRDESLRQVHNEAGLVTPDGMPLVWLSRLAGHRNTTRVYGPDLLLACCNAGLAHGWRHYFYGGAPGIAERLAARLVERYSGLAVAGAESPPYRALTPEEESAAAERMRNADIVWVGLGTPKQERWMHSHVGVVRAPVLIGVGAAFDFLSGAKRQAPRWMQRSGLEWLYRMAREPLRLGGRYLVNNPLFLWRVVGQALGVRRYELPADESVSSATSGAPGVR